MQDKNFEKRKGVLLQAIGKALRNLRGERPLVYYDLHGLSSVTLLAAEKGHSDSKISTLYKTAHALGLTFPQFIDLIEKELPKGFSMADE